MTLNVKRYYHGQDFTLGLMFVDGKFETYTLEDEVRDKKVWGETRIPDGEYEVKLRTEGRMHEQYAKKFPGEHFGMLHLQNVPGFELILIHIGNTDEDTAGCILVGDDPSSLAEAKLGQSTVAYERLYQRVTQAIRENNHVTIKIESI
jgi:hypothetical protein